MLNVYRLFSMAYIHVLFFIRLATIKTQIVVNFFINVGSRRDVRTPPPPLSTTGGYPPYWQRKWKYLPDFAVISVIIGHFKHWNLKIWEYFIKWKFLLPRGESCDSISEKKTWWNKWDEIAQCLLIFKGPSLKFAIQIRTLTHPPPTPNTKGRDMRQLGLPPNLNNNSMKAVIGRSRHVTGWTTLRFVGGGIQDLHRKLIANPFRFWYKIGDLLYKHIYPLKRWNIFV